MSTPAVMRTELLQQCSVCGSTMLDVVDPECNVARCRVCGFIFENPRPTLEELIGFYSKPGKYDSCLNEHGPRHRLWQPRRSKRRSPRKTGALRDVGTG